MINHFTSKMKKARLDSQSLIDARRGFTLIELMTAISIFIVIMVISMGAITGIFDANRKSRSMKTAMTNLNLAVESMSKEMRFGKNYYCGSTVIIIVPRNCPSGDSSLSFLSQDNRNITYRLNGTSIEKRTGAGSFVAVTAPEIVIDRLIFHTFGAGIGDTLQPKIRINIRGHVGSGTGRSDLILQTFVSQRSLDI